VNSAGDRDAGPAIHAYQEQFLERLRQIPAVETAAAANSTPMAFFDANVDCAPRRGDAMYYVVTPEYLSAVRIPLVSGPRAVKIEISAPTANSARQLNRALAPNAFAPDVAR